MKKALFLLLLSFCIMPSIAQNSNEIEKLVKTIPDDDPIAFWRTLRSELQDNKDMIQAIDDRKSSMMEAVRRLPPLSFYPKLINGRTVYTPEAEQLIRTINDVTHTREAFPSVCFYVVKANDEPNAGMYPDGTCEINSYWLYSDSPIEELIAVCCHEIGHFVCNHRIRDTWKTVKAENRNKIWAQIGTGLAMGAYAGSQVYAAQNGVAQSSQAQQQMYNNIANAGIRAIYEGEWYANYRQKFMYYRNSETEADEIAFWFMEKNGIDPIHLINLFKKLASGPQIKLTKQMKKLMDHPEFKKRIAHLEKMYKEHHKSNFVAKKIVVAKVKNILNDAPDEIFDFGLEEKLKQKLIKK